MNTCRNIPLSHPTHTCKLRVFFTWATAQDAAKLEGLATAIAERDALLVLKKEKREREETQVCHQSTYVKRCIG